MYSTGNYNMLMSKVFCTTLECDFHDCHLLRRFSLDYIKSWPCTADIFHCHTIPETTLVCLSVCVCVCVPGCRCEAAFSTGNCETGTGKCICRPEYAGVNCDRYSISLSLSLSVSLSLCDSHCRFQRPFARWTWVS